MTVLSWSGNGRVTPNLSHKMSADCWCQPVRSAEANGTVWHEHHAISPAEEHDDTSVLRTAEMINNRARE